MVSEAKKKRAAAKKEKVAAVTGQPLPSQKEAAAQSSANSSTNDLAQIENGVNGVAISDRACTGILSSHPQSRDVHFESFSLLFHGHELLQDSDLELNFGRWDLLLEFISLLLLSLVCFGSRKQCVADRTLSYTRLALQVHIQAGSKPIQVMRVAYCAA